MQIPGKTLTLSAPVEVCAPIIIRSLQGSRYRLKSAPGPWPAKLRWGSLAVSVVTEATAEILPVGLLPGVWHKGSPATVRIFAVPPATGTAYTHALRVDIRPDSGTTFFLVKRFWKDLDKAVAALQAQQVLVEVGEATKTADSDPLS